jgi:large subunit ribosomal protein L23
MQFSEDIIIRPLMTEKCVNLQDNQNKYSFVVAISANKIDIKKVIIVFFDVEIEFINIMNYFGKKVSCRFCRFRVSGRKCNSKKAIVTLKEGFEIDFFKEPV